jgi:thiamine pyrophosphate-dependent acetolactate synthase large subunit-like protein
MYFGSSNESGVNIPDIKKITKSYGLKYSCISNSVELNSKLNKILKSDKAEIIEVKIDPKNIFIQN